MASESADQATTTLHIAIGGLCLLVRDDRRPDSKKMLHVLFPKDPAGMPHRAALMVHSDFRRPEDMNEPDRVPLNGVILELPSAIKRPPEGKITESVKFGGVIDEKCLRGEPAVPRRLLDKGLEDELKARITITAGRKGTRKGPGVDWILGACPKRKMATWVHWQIPGLPAGDVDLQCGARTLRLRPKNREIELVILHEMKLPPSPLRLSELRTTYKAPENRRAPHFRAFFPLLGLKDDHPIPVHGTGAQSGRHDHEHTATPEARDGLDYTCIMATAPAEPPKTP